MCVFVTVHEDLYVNVCVLIYFLSSGVAGDVITNTKEKYGIDNVYFFYQELIEAMLTWSNNLITDMMLMIIF